MFDTFWDAYPRHVAKPAAPTRALPGREAGAGERVRIGSGLRFRLLVALALEVLHLPGRAHVPEAGHGQATTVAEAVSVVPDCTLIKQSAPS